MEALHSSDRVSIKHAQLEQCRCNAELNLSAAQLVLDW